jgi:predicted dehydrogenase
MPEKPLSVTIIGCGGMARYHVHGMLAAFPGTVIPVLCEPSPVMYADMVRLFEEAGLPPPPNEPDLSRLLATYGPELDAAFIISPHVYHYEQAKACLEAGLDVLLEKPMVMTTAEAASLTAIVRATGRLLVVAFQGSLSPEVRAAVALLRSGQLGRILNISGNIWQNWAELTAGSWRVQPELAGGGFFFDTGAHLLNTVAELAGEPFVEVAAWLCNHDRLVDVTGVVMGRLHSGALVTLNACGNTSPSCASDITVWCTEGMLRTGAWGRFLEVQRDAKEGWQPVEVPLSHGPWEQFVRIRDGSIDNPSPVEVGLRMAHLWDAIRASAARHGQPVPVPTAASTKEASHV